MPGGARRRWNAGVVSVVYTHDIFSRQAAGGISRYFVELIRGVAAVEDCVVLAGLHRNRHLAGLNGVKVLGRYAGKSLEGGIPGAAARFGNRMRQELSLPKNRHFVIHHTYYGFVPPARRGRLVVTVHDMIPELFGSANGSRAAAAGLRLAKKLSCRRAERVIAVSETTKRDLCERYDLDESRVDVIPHGNAFERFAGRRFDRPHIAPYLLYVGPRRGYKNWTTLVEGFARSKALTGNFDLVCFGGGPARTEEFALISARKLEGRVCFVQGDDERLAAFYQHATAYVCPSLYEGFGLPCVEAMGFGCPVACSDRGSLPEVVGPAGVYFDPDDTESVTSAIEKLVFDRSAIEAMKPLIAERERRFRWSDTFRATLETYRRAAGESSGGGREDVRKAA